MRRVGGPYRPGRAASISPSPPLGEGRGEEPDWQKNRGRKIHRSKQTKDFIRELTRTVFKRSLGYEFPVSHAPVDCLKQYEKGLSP
jgi:hypothetical protein